MGANAAKRAFVRELGMLVDEFREDDTPCELRLFEAEVVRARPMPPGEVLRGREAAFLVRAGEPRTAQPGAEYLLGGLREFESAAPLGLLGYLDVPGVREALVEATRRVPARGLATYAQALAVVGGSEAAEVLRGRRTELMGLVRPGVEQSTDDIVRGVGLMNCAAAGLVLDGTDVAAARLLVEMMESSVAWWRELALSRAGEIAARHLSRAAGVELIRRELESRAATEDPSVFVRIAPYLIIGRQEWVVERCQALIPSGSVAMRGQLYNVLRQTTPPTIGVGLLVRWLKKEQDVRLAIGLVSYLHPLVEEGVARALLSVALADSSPSLRLLALDVMNAIPLEAQRSLLEAAVGDEPDPVLLRRFREKLTEIGATHPGEVPN